MSNQQNPTITKKFSLIDFLMILMLVGIVFTLIIPIREDRKNHQKVKEAISDMQAIIRANIQFKNDPDNGYYAFDVMQLNIDHLLEQNYFNYTLSDTTVNAVSGEDYAVEGAVFYYYLPAGPWLVKDDEVSRAVIDPNWLP